MESTEIVVTPKRELIKPGWYLDMDNETYHKGNGTSSSQIKTLMEQTPAHLYYNRYHPKSPTTNMALGTAVHTLVLEPDMFEQDIAVSPEFNKRTNQGKADFADFKESSKGKTIITEGQYQTAQKMAARVHEDPIASILVQDLIVESSVFQWYHSMDAEDDTQYKELLKVRPDGISRGHPILIDLKTCADGSYTGFIKAIQNFYYHLSAAMYLELCNKCQPLLDETKHFAFTKFVFVCVENFAPYEVSVYELSEEYLNIGKMLFRRGVQELKRGRDNDWPGYPDGVRVLEAPSWASRGHIV